LNSCNFEGRIETVQAANGAASAHRWGPCNSGG
jgi:hypothetical protein